MRYNTPKNIIAFTTKRDGGISPAPFDSNNLSFSVPDEPSNVITNRKNVANELGFPLENWVFVRQQHTDQIQKVDHSHAGRGSLSYEDGIPGVDALYTFEANLVLAFFHADCVPVLMFDETTNLLVAIHAGWQGTLKEITKKSLVKIINDEQIDPRNIKVLIGPALSFNSCQIDPSIVEQDYSENENIQLDESGHLKLDVVNLNIQQCLEAGILPENILNESEDTLSFPDKYFSFQRDQATGRHLSGIVRVATIES